MSSEIHTLKVIVLFVGFHKLGRINSTFVRKMDRIQLERKMDLRLLRKDLTYVNVINLKETNDNFWLRMKWCI